MQPFDAFRIGGIVNRRSLLQIAPGAKALLQSDQAANGLMAELPDAAAGPSAVPLAQLCQSQVWLLEQKRRAGRRAARSDARRFEQGCLNAGRRECLGDQRSCHASADNGDGCFMTTRQRRIAPGG